MFDPMKRLLLLVLLGVFVFLPEINAQVHTDTLSKEEVVQLQRQLERELRRANRKYRVQFLPILYYTPETRLAFGAGANVLFKFDYSDTLLPVSKVTPSFIYSQNQQLIANVGFDLYSNQFWRIYGDLGYYVYPYFFSGVGNGHDGQFLEWYDSDYPKLNFNVYRNLFNDSLSVGLLYDYQKTTVNPQSGGLLEEGGYPGSEGSLQSGIGIGFRYDSRDFLLSATQGWFADFSWMWIDSWIGADYKDQFVTIDVRKYFPFAQKKDVMAFQVYSEMHFGDVPFNLMALLGGPERMRGYRQGIYRDRSMMVYQIEYRSRLFWKHFGVVAFANVGGIGDDFIEANSYPRFTFGGGLRIAVLPEERYFIRLDYGVGESTQGFYIAIGEAF